MKFSNETLKFKPPVNEFESFWSLKVAETGVRSQGSNWYTCTFRLQISLLGMFDFSEHCFWQVVTDILAPLDCRYHFWACLISVSTAFDTVDHSILLRRLEISFWHTGCCARMVFIILDWEKISRYLFIMLWPLLFLDYGVPQGSVLGPVLFLLYTSDPVELVRSFGLLAHAYADDLQVYCHMNVGS